MAVDVLVCVATARERTRLADGPTVAVVETGVGPVNAAVATALFLERTGARAVVVCGVGGAYPGAGLEVGSVVCAATEEFGDLGAETPDGFRGLDALGLGAGGKLALDLFPAAVRVPFVTCATCTGTDARARALAARTGGAVESMEGAAIVQVARQFGVPVGEVRGISNAVGDRDRAAWRIDEAAGAAQAALIAWLERRTC